MIDSKHGRYLQVLAFLNSILLINQLNQVVVIATGCNSCNFIFDSSSVPANPNLENGRMPALCSNLLQKLEEFVTGDEKLSKEVLAAGIGSSLLSGSLSMALCCILDNDFTIVLNVNICLLRMNFWLNSMNRYTAGFSNRTTASSASSECLLLLFQIINIRIDHYLFISCSVMIS